MAAWYVTMNMQIIRDVKKISAYTRALKAKKRVVGFVPTMGALHEGHLSLVRASRKECGSTIVSIFVNPLQFAQGEDYAVYPRTLKEDTALLRREKVDCLFLPAYEPMYPERFSTTVEETVLSQGLCGAVRPGHFKGVATVIAKLFNLVCPDRAYFGRKDYQQALVINKMVQDLNFPISVRILPTMRDHDGVAMSSRNTYLSSEERMDAEYLYKSLLVAKDLIEQGERDPGTLIQQITKVLRARQSLQVQYIEVRNAEDLTPVGRVDCPVVIALAVLCGTTRLIDNMVVRFRRGRLVCEL